MKFNAAWVKAPTFVPAEQQRSEGDFEAGHSSTEITPKHDSVTTETPGIKNSEKETVDENAQVGVQKIEATTSSWSKRQLIIAYLL